MKTHLAILLACLACAAAQSLYYQRQKAHREGTAHRNDQQQQQQRWRNNGQQQGRNGHQNGYQNGYRNQQYGRYQPNNYQNYRNVQGQGMSVLSHDTYFDSANPPRVQLTIQLTSYSNPNRYLPNDMQCYDNQPAPGFTADKTKTPSSDRDCMFTFSTMVIGPYGQPLKTYQTDQYVQLTQANAGGVDLTQLSAWSTQQQAVLTRKPESINVLVIHSGNMRYRNGSWPYNAAIRYSVLVDTFYQNTTGDRPSTSSSGQTITLTGTTLETSLSLQYGLQCLPNPDGGVYLGDNCDLICNGTTTNDGDTICHSDITGIVSLCKRSDGTDCEQCVNGFDGTNCRTALGTYIPCPESYKEWKTVGIIFIILTAILAIILLLCIFFWWWTNKRDEKSTNWSQWPYSRGRAEEPTSPTRPAPPLPVKDNASTAVAGSRDSYRRGPESEGQNPEWYQPNVVSVNNQRTQPDTASRHSSQMADERGSQSSYGMVNGRMAPRREAAV